MSHIIYMLPPIVTKATSEAIVVSKKVKHIQIVVFDHDYENSYRHYYDNYSDYHKDYYDHDYLYDNQNKYHYDYHYDTPTKC